MRHMFSILVTILVALALNCECAAQLADGAWPCAQQNLQRTGRSPSTRFDTPRVQWTFHAADQVLGSPIIGIDNIIYFTTSMFLYAVNPDGNIKWSYQLLTDAEAGPVQGHDGKLYLSARNGEIYFFNQDGSPEWHQNVDANSTFAPTIGPDGMIYFGTEEYLMAMDENHKLQWHFKGDLAQYSNFAASPAIAPDGTIYVTCTRLEWQTALVAISPDGEEVHSPFYTANVPQITPAIGDDGAIYLPVGSYLYALNPDLTQKWRFVTSGLISSTPSITANGDIFISTGDSRLYCISEDGPYGKEWFIPMSGGVTASVVSDAMGFAYVADPDGTLIALTPDAGLQWSFTLGATPCGQMAVGPGGEILIGLENGSLVCLGSVDSGNTRPSLVGGSVWPAEGNVGDTFTFSVDYYDADGDAPQTIYTWIDDSAFEMELTEGTPDNGTYEYATTLGLGEYKHYFSAMDARGAWVRYPEGSSSFQGPMVTDEVEIGPNLTLVLEKDTFRIGDIHNLYAYAENPGPSPKFVDIYIALEWWDGKTLFFLPSLSTTPQPIVSRFLLESGAKTPMYKVLSQEMPGMLEANYAWLGVVTAFDNPNDILWLTRKHWRFTER